MGMGHKGRGRRGRKTAEIGREEKRGSGEEEEGDLKTG